MRLALTQKDNFALKRGKKAVGFPLIPAPPSGLIPRSRGSRGVALCVYNYMPPLPHLGISNSFTRYLEMIANIFNSKRFLKIFYFVVECTELEHTMSWTVKDFTGKVEAFLGVFPHNIIDGS